MQQPKTALVERTALRLRTRLPALATQEDIDTQLRVQAGIKGAMCAYQEGNEIISLHEDTIPTSKDNPTAKRVKMFVIAGPSP